MKMRRRKSAWPLVLASTLTAATGLAEPTPQFSELGHRVDYLASAAQGRFAKADLDGDGVQDLAFVGYAGGPVLFVLGKLGDGTLGFKLSRSIPEDGGISRLLAWSSAGQSHIVSIGANGSVRDYSGWPLTESRSFPVIPGAVAGEIENVDNSGADDLVVLTSEGLYAYSMTDGLLEWDYPTSGNSDLALAQLDADPALELILAGGIPGLVLDGATRATDWQYIDGFGARLATGRFASGGGTQWAGAAHWNQFTVFRAAPWSPLWTGSTPMDIGAVATATLDSSGRDVILYGDGQWGSVHVVDTITHQDRFSLPNEGYGVNAIASADVDADGISDIAFASAEAYSFSNDPLLTVANGQSGAVSWQFFPTDGPFVVSAQGDVDGDGRVDLVVATNPYASNGRVAIFDMETGEEEWRGPGQIGNANDPFYIAVSEIKLVPHVGSPGMDIVLAGTSVYDGRITVVNGVTRQVSLQIGYYSSGPMMSRNVKGLALLDYNNDGVQDFVVATQPSTTGASGALLQVFSGVDGASLWTSVAMGSGFSTINGVVIADPPSGLQGKELVAVLPESLRAYNSQNGLLTWVIAAANDGAVYVPNGVSGPELGVFLGGGAVTFYNAKTQAYARSFTLPAPLRDVVAAGGDLHTLFVEAADSVAFVDGESGNVRAVTEYLAPFPEAGSKLSVSATNNASWLVASGTQAALFRHRLDLSDSIFSDSFEAP